MTKNRCFQIIEQQVSGLRNKAIIKDAIEDLLKMQIGLFMEDIDKKSSEQININGLRHYGISWEELLQIAKKYGYEERQRF